MKRSKKYVEAASKVEAGKKYTLEEAVKLLKEIKFANFDESVNIDIRTGLDARHSDQQIRGTVSMPNGTGKTKRVVVIAQGEKISEAEQAGADFAGGVELVEKIQKGWMDFDAAIATPDMMKEVAKLGKALGPRGLMPNPKTGTVTFEIANAIKEIKAGKVEFRLDKTAIIHAALAKISFEEGKIVENIVAYLDAIIKAKPAAAKGKYIKSIALSTTMSPGVAITYGIY